jgi:antitoxin (DNA-binding transcriptional repressor) of toxin-antitoxin stability system
MTAYSVAEAKNRLSELLDRAERGEDVVITRHGRPVVEMRAFARRGRPVTDLDLDWLAQQRPSVPYPKEDAASLVSDLRDEWER